jgi:hypothetical protein
MRTPDFETDGWSLDDGEELHRDAPTTFWIPPLADRQALKKGDLAKLVFRIAVDNDDDPVTVERMWVIVTECWSGGYIGILDNEPDAITENGDFWLGAELPFEYRHIINIHKGTEQSKALADAPPSIPWRR